MACRSTPHATMRHLSRGVALAPLLLVALACREEREPVARARSTAVAARAPAAPTLSRFDVPLAYDFTDVLRTVERVVPSTFGSLSDVKRAGDGDRTHYAYVATRGPFTAFAHGTEVHLRTTLSYTVRAYYKPPIGPTLGASCGTHDPRPRIVAELVAPLTLTPDWHLRSAARIASLAPASASDRDKCRISFLSIDVTAQVLDAARKGIGKHLRDIDDKVGAVNLTNRATDWWARLNAPIRLAEGTWLLLQPRQLRFKGVTGERHVLDVAAGLDAVPVIVTGPRPNHRVLPLPPLGNDSGAAGFHVSLEGTVDYATASRALTTELGGRTVTIGRRTVRVRSLSATRSTGGRLALSVSFTGDAIGTVQFIGTPRFNRATDQIVVSDLDFDLTTDSQLINAYAWLRSDVLLGFFREKARLPSAPVVAQGARLIERGINRTIGGVLTLAGRVDSLVVLGVWVEPRGLTVRALVVGDASVAVRPKRR